MTTTKALSWGLTKAGLYATGYALGMGLGAAIHVANGFAYRWRERNYVPIPADV